MSFKPVAIAAPPPPPTVQPTVLQKPKLTVVATQQKARPTKKPVAVEEAYEPLPKSGLPSWLPWAIGAGVFAAIMGLLLAWRSR